jgi:uncharacterized protein
MGREEADALAEALSGRSLVDPLGRNPMRRAKIVAQHQHRWLLERARAKGLSTDEYVRAVAERLSGLLSGGEIVVRAPADEAIWFLTDGIYRPWRGRDPDRLLFPGQTVDPVYGYLADPGEARGDAPDPRSPAVFGRVKFVLDDSVRLAATYFVGDSGLAMMGARSIGELRALPMPVSVPSRLAANLGPGRPELLDRRACSTHPREPYIEVQLHGGLILDFVKRIELVGDRPPGPLQAFADVRGLELRCLHPQPTDDTDPEDEDGPAAPTIDVEKLLRAVNAKGTAFASRSVVHGPRHWRDVARVGLTIAQHHPGVDLDVVLCFAMLHDSQRRNDGDDPEHGLRAAYLARQLARDGVLDQDWSGLPSLLAACYGHVQPWTTGARTTGCCCDADRLTLWRVGVEPRADLLSTEIARSRRASDWSRRLVEGPDMTWAAIIDAYRRGVPTDPLEAAETVSAS